MIVFDYQRKKTFENVKKWIETIKLRAPVTEPTILVMGNKKDLVSQG